MRALIAAISATALSIALPAAAAAQTLLRDTEIEHVLHEYTDPLLVAAGLDPNDVGMYLIGDNEINAFVTGGQNIFVNTGTILEAENPGQLKGVLAHETGHIAGAHLARMSEAGRGAMVPMFVSIGLGLIAAMAGEGGAAGALIASGPQFGTLHFFTHTRTQESAADQAALQYLTATGQSGQGLVEFFERFRYQEVFSEARRYRYFITHPLSSERIAALRQGVEESPYRDVRATPEEQAELERIQAKIFGFMARPGQVFARYPESDTSLPARYARAVAYYQDAQLDRARAEIESLIAEEPENPYFFELYGQMLFESGHAEEAIPYHQQSVDLMPAAALLRVNLAMAIIAANDDTLLVAARDHLRVATDIEPDNSFAWYNLSLVHERMGNTALAQLAIAEQAYAIGDRMRAFQFATRAMAELEQGTTARFRAAELIAVAQPTEEELRDMQRQRRQQERQRQQQGRLTGLAFPSTIP